MSATETPDVLPPARAKWSVRDLVGHGFTVAASPTTGVITDAPPHMSLYRMDVVPLGRREARRWGALYQATDRGAWGELFDVVNVDEYVAWSTALGRPTAAAKIATAMKAGITPEIVDAWYTPMVLAAHLRPGASVPPSDRYAASWASWLVARHGAGLNPDEALGWGWDAAPWLIHVCLGRDVKMPAARLQPGAMLLLTAADTLRDTAPPPVSAHVANYVDALPSPAKERATATLGTDAPWEVQVRSILSFTRVWGPSGVA